MLVFVDGHFDTVVY